MKIFKRILFILSFLMIISINTVYASDITPEEIHEYRLLYGPQAAKNLAILQIKQLTEPTYYQQFRSSYLSNLEKPLPILETKLTQTELDLANLRKKMRESGPGRKLRAYETELAHQEPCRGKECDLQQLRIKCNLGTSMIKALTPREQMRLGDDLVHKEALEGAIAAKKRYFEDSFFNYQHPSSLHNLCGQ